MTTIGLTGWYAGSASTSSVAIAKTESRKGEHMKRLFVLGMLLWAPGVWAQCSGYSITSTGVNLLTVTNAAAQGAVTGTVTTEADVKDSNGNQLGIPSHNLTVTPGTWVGFQATANNATSGYLYWTIDNDTTQHNMGMNGGSISNPHVWFMQTTDIGHTYHVFYPVSGSTGSSLDHVNVTTVAGTGPSISNQDGVWTNAYYQLVSKFGGGSMMNNCNECQLHPNMCINKTHTPLFDATLTNPGSGETQTISNASAGNVVSENQSVSGTASIMISVLPGDSPSGSTTNKIYCTMFGWIMAQQWNPGIPDVEMAVTAEEIIPSSCTLVLRFFQQVDDWGIQCNVAWKKPPATSDRCNAASQVPDFNPGAIWDEQNCKTPGNCGTSDMPPPNGTNASYPKYWYTASWGVRFPSGAPNPDPPILNGGAHNWVFPIYLADGYVPGGPNEDWWILDLLNLAIPKGTGLPIDCTYRDHGTSPIPNPF